MSLRGAEISLELSTTTTTTSYLELFIDRYVDIPSDVFLRLIVWKAIIVLPELKTNTLS